MTARLTGRTALVTGSTSGIGRAIATRFAAEGARVIVTGRRAEVGEKVVAAINEAGGSATFVAGDLSSGSGVNALAAAALEAAGGRVDILVNNAAALVGGAATVDTAEDLIDRVLSTNIKALVPAMLAYGAGAIVNVGSINGLIGMNGAALYGASKAALHSLTKSWVAEWGRLGVRVNTVAPGPTETEWNAQHSEYIGTLLANVPTRRMSRLSEVADVAVFLASDEASHVHGATIPVDGGMSVTRGGA
jgi:NAD(P)-dependent dehydrogenase (short-subunit alcohol dehydrogenase family)